MPRTGFSTGPEPQRTCVACRKVGGKGEFVRLAKCADGLVAVDESGKGRGRGAYLCLSAACWSRGITAGQIERALRVKLDAQTAQGLTAYGVKLGGKKEVRCQRP